MNILREILIDGMIILLGLVYATMIVIYAAPLATSLGVMDYPRSQAHKAHARPTPLVGGIACLPPALLALTFGVGFQANQPEAVNAMAWLAFAGAASMIVGFFDDRQHIPATIRLLICGAIFAVPLALHSEFVIQRVYLESLHFSFNFGSFAIGFSLLCLLAFQNAVNMADGRNGLVIGLSIIWSLTLLAQGAHPSNLAVACLLAGLSVTFLANCAGRLFLGDAGTYGIAAMIGLTTVWIHRSNIGFYTVHVVTMFIIPILDMGRLIGLRLLRRQSPFAADHSHLHHYLDRAFGWALGRRIYFTLVIVPIIIAFVANRYPLLGVFAAIGGYIAIITVSNVVVNRRIRHS